MAENANEEIVTKKSKKKAKKGKKGIGTFFKKHKKLTVFFIILIILGLLVWKAVSCVQDSQNLLNNMMNGVLTAEVAEENLINSISATGTVTSVETVVLTSTVTGVDIEELNVSLGDKVNAGDILCVLDSEDFEEGLANVQKNKNATAGRTSIDVNAANRGLNEALTTQSIDLDRADKDIKDAYNDVNSTANDCQEALDNYNSLNDQLSAAEGRMKNAEVALKQAEAVAKGPQDNMYGAQSAFDSEKQTLIIEVAGLSDAERATFVAGYSDLIQIGRLTTLDSDGNRIAVVDSTTLCPSADTTTKAKVDAALAKLRVYEENYQIAEQQFQGPNAKCATEQAAYSAAYQEVETLKAKRDAAKSTYDALAKSVESGWDIYNQRVRNKEDVTRADASNVASRNDNLKATNINASVATLSDDTSIKKYEQQIDDCVIRSGISGIVTAINVKQGDMYAGGAIVTIEDTSSYEITSNIGEYDIAKVQLGQKVTIKTNGTGDVELEGVVKEISPRANANTANGVTYPVKISILTKNDDIRLDMTAKINIVTEEKANALCVPYDAVLTDEDGNFYVDVLDGDAPLKFEDLQDPIKAATMTEDQKKMAAGEMEPKTHKVLVKKGLQNNYFIEIIGIDETINSGVTVVYPNDTSYTDIMEYLSVNGGY